LVAALADLEPAHRRRAVATLAAREHEPAIAAAVGSFSGYDADLQAALIERADAFATGARLCMSSEEIEERFAAVAFIRAARRGKLAYLLADALAQPCRKTAEMAGLALGDLVEDVVARCRPMGSAGHRRQPDEREFVVQAVAKSLSTWPLHFRGEVAAAASLLAAPLEHALLGMVDETRTRTARALTGILESSRDPRHVPLALRMLRSTQLREVAARYLAAGRGAPFAAALLDESWILADEAVRRAFVRVRTVPCLDLEADRAATNVAREYAQARVVASLGSGPGRKAEALRRLALGGAPRLARAAGWASFELVGEPAEEAMRALAARTAHPLAALAKIELERRRLAESAASSERSSVSIAAGTAEQAVVGAPQEESAFEVFWEQAGSLPLAERIAVGRQVAASAEEFDRGVRAKLTDADPNVRLRALNLVRELELEARFAEQLVTLGTDADRLVRSAAVGMLGAIDTPSAWRVLRTALDDPDDRVQANAIEALERRAAASVREQVAAKLESPSSRVRANAVKLLLRMRIREGAAHLLAMLGSARTSDRLSALWVVERIKLSGVVAKLEALAASDPDLRIRRRAQRVRDALGGVAPAGAGGRSREDGP
jgi:hypothetical protein